MRTYAIGVQKQLIQSIALFYIITPHSYRLVLTIHFITTTTTMMMMMVRIIARKIITN
jgi:hypothetical protein